MPTRVARTFVVALLAVAVLPVTSWAQNTPAAEAPADSVGLDWSQVPRYRIVPGDELILNFGPDPKEPFRDISRKVLVRPDGRITVFPVGDVLAAGHTTAELEGILVQLLSAEFRQPRVVVEVTKLAGNQVHVLGSVHRPGSYDAGPFVTVMQAIAMAGGFEDDASRNSVLVFHRDGASTVRVRRLKLDQAIKSGNLAIDAPLSRFDIVYVPRSTVGNVLTFSRAFFGSTQYMLTSALLGWELFDRTNSVVLARP